MDNTQNGLMMMSICPFFYSLHWLSYQQTSKDTRVRNANTKINQFHIPGLLPSGSWGNKKKRTILYYYEPRALNFVSPIFQIIRRQVGQHLEPSVLIRVGLIVCHLLLVPILRHSRMNFSC